MFSNFFGGGTINFDEKGWKTLDTLDQIPALVQRSHSIPVLIYKHSTTCGISMAAQDRLHDGWDIPGSDVEFYHLDLLAHRDVSNAVAQTLGVVHHSPQVILIKDGEVVYHTSHHMISVEGVKMAL